MALNLSSLKARFYTWLATKGILYGFQQLASQRLGQRLNAAMDARWGAARSDAVQKELAKWLESVAADLKA